MAHFPLFIDLNGALVFLVGEDDRKEELLRSFGGRVRRLSCLTEEELAENPRLVVLAGGDRAGAATLCRSRGIPVNSVDDPQNCTFFFPSVIRRADAVIAVSSGGKAPAAAKALSAAIEQALPDDLEQLLPWLGELTARLRARIPDYRTRALLLDRITAKAFALGRPLSPEELEML